ncbi:MULTISPECIES: NYN domain-containing protein [unclassified Frankia]|uniref:NYN domain-containing protein n=1 Tax=unclassified Frankia TaxID=2632575 RepID=UPI002AD33909|nr:MULTISPECIES: NYN domain-containing protein [unclassified Frankia]
MATKLRVGLYVDGFNLYHGLHSKYGRKYLWLDLEALGAALIRPDQELSFVRYFTARVEGPGVVRQRAYLAALTEHCHRLKIVEGRFQKQRRTCRFCGATWQQREEKETDVSIAVSLVEDCVDHLLDVALILSADQDLSPAIRAMKTRRPNLRVVAVFPPDRNSDALAKIVDAKLPLFEQVIKNSQLPAKIAAADGRILTRPDYWS